MVIIQNFLGIVYVKSETDQSLPSSYQQHMYPMSSAPERKR